MPFKASKQKTKEVEQVRMLEDKHVGFNMECDLHWDMNDLNKWLHFS